MIMALTTCTGDVADAAIVPHEPLFPSTDDQIKSVFDQLMPKEDFKAEQRQYCDSFLRSLATSSAAVTEVETKAASVVPPPAKPWAVVVGPHHSASFKKRALQTACAMGSTIEYMAGQLVQQQRGQLATSSAAATEVDRPERLEL